MSKFLSNEDIMKTFSNTTRRYLNIFYVSFIFYYYQQVLFTLRVSSLLTPLNDASGNIVDGESSFQFSPEAEYTSPLQQTLKQNHRASHNCYSVKSMLKLLAFKWLLNELLLETEWSELMFIWWFVSIKFIRSFLKFSFCNAFLTISLVISTWFGKTVPFRSTGIIQFKIFKTAELLFRRNNMIWCKGLVCKSSTVAPNQVI